MSDSENRRRTKFLPSVRCFEEEEEAVRQKAYDCGMSVGAFMLSAALNRPTRSRVEGHILNELRKLGGFKNTFSTKVAASFRRNTPRYLWN